MKKLAIAAIALLVLAGAVAFSVSVLAQSEQKNPDTSGTTLNSPSYAVKVASTQESLSVGSTSQSTGNCCGTNSTNSTGAQDSLPPCHKNLQSGQDPGNTLPQTSGGCCGGSARSTAVY